MSPPRKLLCVQCTATLVGTACAFYAGSALAADQAANRVSLDAWVALIFAIISALIAGYARGIDKRLERQELVGTTNRDLITSLRADMLRDHASKQETRDHREQVRQDFERVHARLDEIVGMVGRRRGDA